MKIKLSQKTYYQVPDLNNFEKRARIKELLHNNKKYYCRSVQVISVTDPDPIKKI